MLGLVPLVLSLRFLWRWTGSMKTVRTVVLGADVASDYATKTYRLSQIKKEMKEGRNREEEKFSAQQHGTCEMLFPARVREEDLPEGFEKAVHGKATGEFLWKLSEWNSFWVWVQTKLHNSNSTEKIAEGQDGLWLAEAGRRRWQDEEMRTHAQKNAQRCREVWVRAGMWPEQTRT